MAVENGYQGALMAPTEVLAKQHYEDMLKLIEDNNLLINCSLLCGSTKKKKEEYKKIKENKIQIVIGTHALLQESVEFSNLALVVIDEQHRFGVEQRKAIYQKSKDAHILIMSATPIPRSLGQVLYSDLGILAFFAFPEILSSVILKKTPPTQQRHCTGFSPVSISISLI